MDKEIAEQAVDEAIDEARESMMVASQICEMLQGRDPQTVFCVLIQMTANFIAGFPRQDREEQLLQIAHVAREIAHVIEIINFGVEGHPGNVRVM